MNKMVRIIVGLGAVVLSIGMSAQISRADVLCVKGQSVLLVKGSKCAKGTKALNADKLGLTGDTGATGATGATGTTGATGPTSTATSDWQDKGTLASFTGPIDTALCDYRISFGNASGTLYYLLSDFTSFDFDDVDNNSQPFTARQFDLRTQWKTPKFGDGGLPGPLTNQLIADAQDRSDFTTFASSAVGSRFEVQITRVVPGNYQPPSISGPSPTILMYNNSSSLTTYLIESEIHLESRCSTEPVQTLP